MDLKFRVNDEAASKISAHIKTCPKHPHVVLRDNMMSWFEGESRYYTDLGKRTKDSVLMEVGQHLKAKGEELKATSDGKEGKKE